MSLKCKLCGEIIEDWGVADHMSSDHSDMVEEAFEKEFEEVRE